MDFVRNTPETDVMVILEKTIGAFVPQLEKNRSQIESVERKTFKYGATERHQLDVYYPASGTPKPPIFVFVYGGGYFTGDRVRPPPTDLVYKNLGAFFVARGFLTVIPDYRLVPEAVYPNPSEDIRDALTFIVNNLSDAGDTSKIFINGHSAGSAIAATLVLHEPTLLTGDLAGRVRGLALLGGTYHHNGQPSVPPDVLSGYFAGKSDQCAPYGLLKAASPTTLAALPPLLIQKSEKEPDSIAQCHVDFIKLLHEKGKVPDVGVAKEHNHISPHFALVTGDGEEWAETVAEWCKRQL